MQTVTKRFLTFEDLEAYKAAREFRKAMYVIARLANRSISARPKWHSATQTMTSKPGSPRSQS